jgi:hypothetical protein
MDGPQLLSEFFAAAWCWKCGLPDPPVPEHVSDADHEKLIQTQWNAEFERLMRNRLIVGAYRYGPLEVQKTRRYDNISGMQKHLDAYRETGNAEHLVDIANIALVEFTVPVHPKQYFAAEDDGTHIDKV